MSKKMLRSLSASFLALASIASTASSASANWFDCKPTEVMEFNASRVHVKCSNSIVLNGNTVRYVTVGLSNAAAANRFTSIANAALLSDRTFVAFIPTSSASNTSGCLVSDCRTATVWGVK